MINDLKDFEKFLKICRKQGVTDAAFNGLTVKLGPAPTKNESDSDEIQTDGLTEQELLFYAVNNTGAS